MATIAEHTIKGITITVRSMTLTSGYCVVLTDGTTTRQEGIFTTEKQARDYANTEWKRIRNGQAGVYWS